MFKIRHQNVLPSFLYGMETPLPSGFDEKMWSKDNQKHLEQKCESEFL